MENQQAQQEESPLTFSEKCKLVTFVTVVVCIVAYVGICLKTLLSLQFYYPPQTVCDQ